MTSAGSCTAGGYYRAGASRFRAFVVTEQNGRWAKAQQVPGVAVLNVGQRAGIASVSCTSSSLRGRRFLRRPIGPRPGVRCQPDLTNREPITVAACRIPHARPPIRPSNRPAVR
jgi:hypothetical protein